MGEAQNRLALLIKTTWGPALRELGFTGSGKVWTLPDEHDWAMLGFQTSQASTGDEATFTINLMVVGKAAWMEARASHSFYSEKPSPNVIALHRYVQRAGFVTHDHDHWWRLAGDGSNEQQVGNELLAALRDLLAPKLESEMPNRTPGPRGTFANVKQG